jgi:hypothetical protein
MACAQDICKATAGYGTRPDPGKTRPQSDDSAVVSLRERAVNSFRWEDRVVVVTGQVPQARLDHSGPAAVTDSDIKPATGGPACCI